jgi:hypothetical protein
VTELRYCLLSICMDSFREPRGRLGLGDGCGCAARSLSRARFEAMKAGGQYEGRLARREVLRVAVLHSVHLPGLDVEEHLRSSLDSRSPEGKTWQDCTTVAQPAK